MAQKGDILQNKSNSLVALVTDVRVTKYGTRHYSIQKYCPSKVFFRGYQKTSEYSILSQTQLRKRWQPSDLTPAALVLHYKRVEKK